MPFHAQFSLFSRFSVGVMLNYIHAMLFVEKKELREIAEIKS